MADQDNKSAEYWIERCLKQVREMDRLVVEINDSLRQRRQELVREATAAGYWVYHCANCGSIQAHTFDVEPVCACGWRMIHTTGEEKL